MKLSILIPTVVGREKQFESLKKYLQFLCNPYPDEIEISWMCDNKELTIGEKREILYNHASGDYSLQVDDDDMLSLSSIDQIMRVLKNESPDCVTYMERCIMNGTLYKCDHSIKYAAWADNSHGFDYVRTPFMKDVIRTDITQRVPIPHIRYGEDHQWSVDLLPHLKTEHHIDDFIYYYEHESSDFKTRYGFDKD